jgi:Rod binding domain-containing protein
MAPIAPHNLTPFGPAKDGTAPAPGELIPSVRGPAGRYAAASPKDPHEQLVNKTQTWVAQTFFGTLLKQMRNSPFKSELFSGGQGGDKFASLQDQHMAEHMTRGAGRKLVDGIVRRIEANAAYRKQQAVTQKAQSVQPAAAADNRTDHRRQHDLVPWNKPKTFKTDSHAQATRRP